MPIFEYKCEKCQYIFEELILGDAQAPACPKCLGVTEQMLSCACIRMPTPSRVGQSVVFPKSSKSACGGCAGGSCSTCK